MSRVRDFMYNPQWRATYKFGLDEPNNSYYGHWNYDDGGFLPIFIDSNNEYSIRMNRHCSGVCPYDTGIVTPDQQTVHNRWALENCADKTAAPVQCARAVLHPRAQTYPQFTTMSQL